MKQLVRLVVSGLVLCTLAAAAPGRAGACINVVLYSSDEAVRGLTTAERHLGAGRANRAFVAALRVLWSLEAAEGLRDFVFDEGGVVPGAAMQERSQRRVVDLSARAKRVLAIAMVRLGGATTFEPRHGAQLDRLIAVNRTVLRSPTDEQRRQSLAWAVTVLEEAHRAAPDDPIVTAHLGEALGAIAPRRAEGITLLRDLAARDLMPDAWGYRALASLLDEVADAGRDAALQKCRDRAGRQARRICPRFE